MSDERIRPDTGRRRSAGHVLAQYNEARLRASLGDPMIGEFVAGLAVINRLADHSDGFVWRHHQGHDESPQLAENNDYLVVNLSLWRSYLDLHRFVYRSAHGGYVRRRAKWFEPARGPKTVHWWVPRATRPSIEDGRTRLELLRHNGPNPSAFTMRARYDPTGRPERPRFRGKRKQQPVR